MTAIDIYRTPVGLELSKNALRKLEPGSFHAHGMISRHEIFAHAVYQFSAHPHKRVQTGRAEPPGYERHTKIFHIGKSRTRAIGHGLSVTRIGRTHPAIET